MGFEHGNYRVRKTCLTQWALVQLGFLYSILLNQLSYHLGYCGNPTKKKHETAR